MVQAAQYCSYGGRGPHPGGRISKSCPVEDGTAHCVYLHLVACPIGSYEENIPFNTMINESSCRVKHALLCHQHLRDGNLLMLLATRISIRAPFM